MSITYKRAAEVLSMAVTYNGCGRTTSDEMREAIRAAIEALKEKALRSDDGPLSVAERNYVIVANRHRTWPGGSLLFWGRHTEDHEERSFGGYTSRFDQCEKYTRQELLHWRKGDKKHYPFFDELDIASPGEFGEHEEVLCTLGQLQSIGFSIWTVVCTP